MADRNPARIVITGRGGQVVQAFAAKCAGSETYQVLHAARPDFDFEKPETLADEIAALAPDVVINAAAYTAVDAAEKEPERALIINATAAGEVARGAQRAGAPVIQISTDYVFDGTLGRPYREDDPVLPLGVYGRTKLAGETAVAKANSRNIILRTSWVYSPFGRNFVNTMLRLAGTKDELAVVDDQRGNPTSAFVIADALLHVVDALLRDPDDGYYGLYHLAGKGSASWCEFAREIFSIAGPGLPKVPEVNAIATADYPTDAQRPADSRLDTTLFEKTFSYVPPDWRISLAETLAKRN